MINGTVKIEIYLSSFSKIGELRVNYSDICKDIVSNLNQITTNRNVLTDLRTGSMIIELFFSFFGQMSSLLQLIL